MVKIAVDAMGGDLAPESVVKGVELARDEDKSLKFILFGDQAKIEKLLTSKENIEIVQSDEIITMEDEPVRAVKKKKNSSLVMAAHAVKDGVADAFVSAGSSGAVMVAGLLVIGRIKGIDRPGLTVQLPVIDNNHGFTMIDVGANADTKVDNIRQYAMLGKYYAENVRNVKNPRVGLINNGTENDKGNMVHQKMHDALQELGDTGAINFIGNIEPRGLLNGITDVAVTDGFTGNAVLKSTEGSALAVVTMLKNGIKQGGIKAMIGALLLKGTLKKIANKMDYTKYGGAILLGLRAPVVKGHGNSNPETFKNCLFHAKSIVSSGYVDAVKKFITDEKSEN